MNVFNQILINCRLFDWFHEVQFVLGYAFAFLVLKSFIVIIHSNSFFKPLSLFLCSWLLIRSSLLVNLPLLAPVIAFISLVYFINFPLNSIQLNPINLQFKHQFDSMSWIKIEWLNDWLMDLLKLNAGNSVNWTRQAELINWIQLRLNEVRLISRIGSSQ